MAVVVVVVVVVWVVVVVVAFSQCWETECGVSHLTC